MTGRSERSRYPPLAASAAACIVPPRQPSVCAVLQSLSAATQGSVCTFTVRASTISVSGVGSAPPSMWIMAGSGDVFEIATAKSNSVPAVLPVTVGK